MEDLVWSPAMSVGIDAMDEDHRQLFTLLQELRDDIINDGGASALLHLGRLADYTKYHFAREEAILASLNYPDLTAHQSMHEDMVQDIADAVMDQSETPDSDLAIKLHDFILRWLRKHILEEDMAYSELFLKT